jgi:hypothetical protein
MFVDLIYIYIYVCMYLCMYVWTVQPRNGTSKYFEAKYFISIEKTKLTTLVINLKISTLGR